MAETSEILARPGVIGRIRYLVRRALLNADAADPYATHVSLLFAEKLECGAPEVTAINLVAEIREALADELGKGLLIEDLIRAAEDYCWERELGPAAVEKTRLSQAKAALLAAIGGTQSVTQSSTEGDDARR
jgi:hypothetical protein